MQCPYRYLVAMSDTLYPSAKCRTHSRKCADMANNPNISMQRANILSAMSRTWTMLANQTDRYVTVLKMDADEVQS